MRLSIRLPLIIGIIIFVAVAFVTVFSIYIFRENAMERIDNMRNNEMKKRTNQMEDFVNTSIDFLQFAAQITNTYGNQEEINDEIDDDILIRDNPETNESNKEDNEIDVTNLTKAAINFIHESYNRDNLQFWILENKPPYKIRFSTYQADIYNPRTHSIKNSEYDRVASLVDLCARVGEGYEEYNKDNTFGISERKIVFVKQYNKKGWILGVEQNQTELDMFIDKKIESLNKTTQFFIYRSLILTIFLVAVATTLIYLQIINITRNIRQLRKQLINIIEGEQIEKNEISRKDEIGEMGVTLNQFVDKVKSYIHFAEELEKRNLDYEYNLSSKNDKIGLAFKAVQETLRKSNKEEQRRKEENRLNEWINNGVSKFNDILRKRSDSIEVLSDTILTFLIKYLDANQGGLFILNDETEQPQLELVASYAYNRRKFIEKTVEVGENLLGACVLEKSTINIGNLPNNYIEITSGLGTANPTNLLLVPLISDNKVLGVVEMASFTIFANHHVEFVERIAENMASTLGAVHINNQTQKLLEKSRLQAEEMEHKEAELKENVKELRKIYEESQQKESEINSLFKAVNEVFALYKFNLKGYLIDINKVACKTLKVAKEDVLNKHYNEILPDSKMDADLRSIFWDDLRSGQSKRKTRFIYKGNDEYWFDEFYSPIYNKEGVPLAIICLAANLTEIKKLEKENKILKKEILKHRVR